MEGRLPRGRTRVFAAGETMTRLLIELPDEVAATLAERARAAGHASTEAFLAAWACAEWGEAAVASRHDLEAKLLEAIDSGPSEPATREDWDAIRREGQARVAALRRPGV
jgi:hypothetical protein